MMLYGTQNHVANLVGIFTTIDANLNAALLLKELMMIMIRIFEEAIYYSVIIHIHYILGVSFFTVSSDDRYGTPCAAIYKNIFHDPKA